MQEKILEQIAELKGRRTTMEIVHVRYGDRDFKREIVHRPIASAALVETEDGRFVLVRQFRVPVNCEMLEIVAGCVDGDEHPYDCIEREIEEETGHKVLPGPIEGTRKCLYFLSNIKVSPGYTDEVIYLYYARVNDIPGNQRPDDDERVKVVYLTFDELKENIENNKIRDSKTLIAWYEYLNQYGPKEMIENRTKIYNALR